MNASLLYEIFMYLNSFYFGMFMITELSIGVLKAINLHYAENAVVNELCLLSGICVFEIIRIILGRKGSLSDHGECVMLFNIYFLFHILFIYN